MHCELSTLRQGSVVVAEVTGVYSRVVRRNVVQAKSTACHRRLRRRTLRGLVPYPRFVSGGAGLPDNAAVVTPLNAHWPVASYFTCKRGHFARLDV